MVDDNNQWYEKIQDTVPIAGTNIVDLISFAVKPGIATDKPYGWATFIEFLKSHKNIPHVLLTDKVREELADPKIVPLASLTSATATLPKPPSTPPSTYVTPFPTPPASPPQQVPSGRHTRRKTFNKRAVAVAALLPQSGKGLKLYF